MYSRRLVPLILAFAFAAPPVPAWIDRAHVAPQSFIVTYRLADVLGSPIVEGITVDRDPTSGTMNLSVIDSKFDPPRIVHQGTVKGTVFRWLRAGTRDGLPHQIAVATVAKGRETAYLFRVGPGFKLVPVRTTHGQNISPRVFSH